MLRKALLITISTLAVLLVGFGGMSLLMSRRTLPQPQVQENPGKLVRVMTVQLEEVPLTVQGYGTVRPKTEWSVIPEVSGPLAQLSPNLRAGLYVARGELLFEVDPRPYRLVVQQIRAQIEQHQKQIAVLRQQRRNYEDTLRFALRNLKIADEEFRRDKALVGKGMISARERDQRQQSHNEVEQVVQTARNDLALIGPRIQEIQAAIAAAQAQLADAELKLDKTRLLAPFNGQVINSNLEVGEFVQAGNEVATLYDTAAVEIPIALSPDLLRWLPDFVFNTHHYDSQNVAQYRPHVDSDAPPDVLRSPVRTPRTPLENNGAEPLRQSLAIRVQSTRVALPDERREDSHDAVPHPLQWPPATVHWRSGNREYTWQGRVVRSEAGLDEKTRTMKLVVEVQEPRKIVRPGQPPLQPGMFCQVKIDAGSVSDAVVIPRTALHEANTVFLVHDGILTRRPVQVLRELRDQAIITAGLQPGDKLIVYPLTTPIEGMKLRPLEIEAPTPPATPASSRPDRGAAEPRVTGHTKRKS